MARLITPLSEVKCNSAKPKTKDYKLFDGGGLYLLVKASGTKSWRMKFNKPEDSKESTLTFGDYPKISIREAREQREEAKDLLSKGINPKVAKDNAKLKTKTVDENVISFEPVAREWIKQTAKAKNWSQVHTDKMTRIVENYILPSLGNKDIKMIEFSDVLIPIQTALNKEYFELATTIRQTVIKIMRLAVIKGIIRTNPALDLEGLVFERTTKHFPALPIEQLGELANKIYSYPHQIVTRYALILTQHIYIRSSELRFARWNEIDFENRLWKIPQKRKAVEGVKHSTRGAKISEYLVPLSTQVITLLKELHQITGQNEWIFTINGKKPLSENTINQALRKLGYCTKNDICGHGMRAMACSALNESDLFSEDAIERQMSHQERKKVRRAYIHKAKHIQQRVKIMQWWSNYIEYSMQHGYIPPYEFRN